MYYYILLVVNLIVFGVYRWDKGQAIRHKQRVSEKKLLILVLVGGSAGAGLAMFAFRHKISKMSFLLKYFSIVLLQLIAIYFVFR